MPNPEDVDGGFTYFIDDPVGLDDDLSNLRIMFFGDPPSGMRKISEHPSLAERLL